MENLTTVVSPDMASRKAPISLAIIIVNFRTPGLTIDCLRSLAFEISKFPSAQVVVVENGSGDDSSDQIANTIRREHWSDWISLESLERNLGFAGGGNCGYQIVSQARYVLLLNSDTRIHEGTITYCYERMEADNTVGALSCKLLNEDGSVQNVARRFPLPLRLFCSSIGLPWKLPTLFEWADTEDRGWDRNTACRDVDWLGGAFLFLRGDMIRKIGLFDSDFFFFGEDIELCHRIWKAGYRCHYDPRAEVTHLGARSSDETRTTYGWRTRQMWRSRYLVQRKCYGVAAEISIRLLDLCMWSLRTLWRRIVRGADHPAYKGARNLLRILISDFRIIPGKQ